MNYLALGLISWISATLGSILGVLVCSTGSGCPIGHMRKLNQWRRKITKGVALCRSHDLLSIENEENEQNERAKGDFNS